MEADGFRLKLDRRTTIRLGLVAAALLLCVASLFLSWWTLHEKGREGFESFDRSHAAKPFDAGYFSDAGAFEGEGLDTETQATGWLMVVATLGVAALLGVEVLAAAGRTVTMGMHMLPSAAAGLPGLAAILFTAFAWPGGWSAAAFFDHQEIRHTVGYQGDLNYYAGLGWYFGLIGAVITPIGLFLYTHIFNADPGMDQVLKSAGVKESPAREAPAPRPASAPSSMARAPLPPPPIAPEQPPAPPAPTFTQARPPTPEVTGVTRRAAIVRPKK